MKVTLNWLKQYVDFTWSPEELSGAAHHDRHRGRARVEKLGGEFEGVVVGQVLTRDKVAGSDKLSVCRVNDGKGGRQIICGAQNFKAGDKVPLILPNYALPLKPGEKDRFVIKVRKVMGVESHGMLCSPQELGLPDQIDGLLILPPEATVGQPFAEYLGRPSGDVVYDLEITPNRPDLNSVIGIAREISAVTGNPLKLPDVSSSIPIPPGPDTCGVDDLVAVRIEDTELCPRYTARVVRSVKIGPSPDWLKAALEKLGIRSISNVVDVTNYVMLETGQPLHAFDYHLLAASAGNRPTIVVRRAAEGEKFTTLDGQERALTNQMLLIADEIKPIALAGVMGGQNTEINEKTADVLIESAYFKPQNIRATSKQLELRTEASYRYERGADIGICDWASQRAAQLILQTADGQPAAGVVDVYLHPAAPKEITLRHHKVCELLGAKITPAQNVKHLRRLGLEVPVENTDEYCIARIPTFRVDLKGEVDLIEEITRLHGVDNIRSTPPRGAVGSNPYDTLHDALAEVRRILTGLGLNEAQGQTLISSKSVGVGAAVPLANPLSSDMDVLRPSLLPGLLEALRQNLARKNSNVALFELGRVFIPDTAGVREERRVSMALTGLRNPPFWSGDDREAKFDIYDCKGALEEFLAQLGLRGMTYTRRQDSTTLYVESATIQLGKNTLGELGQLSPALAREYDLRDAVLLAELNLDLLLTLARRDLGKTFKPLPAFPAIRRDIAMLVPDATSHEAVLSTVRQTKPQNLEGVELFDIFRGKNVPAGQKSMAYAFTYRSAERTLTDAEVNTTHEKVVEQFRRNLQAVLREE